LWIRNTAYVLIDLLPSNRTARDRQFLPASCCCCSIRGSTLLDSTDSPAATVTTLPSGLSTTASEAVDLAAVIVAAAAVVGKLGLKKHMIGVEKLKTTTQPDGLM
jgi:hypothetical protein